MFSNRVTCKQRTLRFATGLLVAAGGVGFSAAVQAQPINILPLGDSITFGIGDPNNRGYSYFLQNYLVAEGYTPGVDFDFIGGKGGGTGTLTDGSAFDPDRWGWSGALADTTPDTDGLWAGKQNLVDHLQSFTTSQGGTLDGVFTGLNAAGTAREEKVADIVLLGIGTNTLRGGQNASQRALSDAVGQFSNLLGELRVQWDNGRIAADGKVFVAKIIPKAQASGQPPQNDLYAIRASGAYGDQIEQLILNLPDATADDLAFKSMFTMVDMFDIEPTTDLLAKTGLTMGQVNPEAGDSSIDWVLENLDESNPGTFSDTTVTVNNVLLDPDRIHPTEDGYKVLAYQWFNAVHLSGGVVPEPGAMALLGLGGLALLGRPRRSC